MKPQLVYGIMDPNVQLWRILKWSIYPSCIVSMYFSEAFQHPKKLVRFSPNGCYLAGCSQHRLAIRDEATYSLLSVHACMDAIDTIQWSPDSSLVMCGMFQRSVVQVWSWSWSGGGGGGASPPL